ncbi:MAG TPA: penicillin-binding transpeptidase domain-containing protein [Verrucomicrobiales bacterium]|nr:penicillin-binding transpeptidase domain-containing protein [Verrucomicrobiales bacterium]
MRQWQSRLRLYAVVFLLLSGFGALVYQLWQVQINRYEQYIRLAPGTREISVRIPGVRGEIRDRHGATLVGNRFVFEVSLHLKDLVEAYERDVRGKGNAEGTPVRRDGRGREEKDVGEIVRRTVTAPLREMGVEIPFSAEDVQRHYRSTYGVIPYSLTSDLTYREYCVLAERTLGISGVRVEAAAVRNYPLKALASHILGYTSRPDEQRDLEDLRKRASSDGPDGERAREELERYDFYVPDTRGVEGIERSQDDYLRGRPGRQVLQRNEKGVIVREKEFEPAQPGLDVYLTIDARQQHICETALRDVGIGAAVLLDPFNGDILAMASAPSFDPSRFVPTISAEDWNRYLNDPTKPFVNRAIRAFVPGSVFKLAVAAAGCSKELGSRSFNCPGSIRYGNRLQKCWIFGRGAHGYLNLEQAIQRSCNCYFYQYGNAAKIETIVEMGHAFGLGEATGIPLSGESSGLVPGPRLLEDRGKGEKWSNARTALVSIGQAETLASPLQMASVAAAFANGGAVYRPRLVRRIAERDGTPVREPEPELRTLLSEAGVDEAGLNRIRRGMKAVVESPGGTAARIRIEGLEIAGKTGTAEFLREGIMEKHAWFVGFAPYEEPRFAVCVFVFLGKGGSVVAAPIAREILVRGLEVDGNPQIQPAPMEETPGQFLRLEAAPVFDGSTLLVGAGDQTPEEGDGDAGILDPDDARLSTGGEDSYEVPGTIRIRPPAVETVEAGSG